MLNKYARVFFTRVLTPVARGLVRLGVSPDVVTLLGTFGVCAGALAFYPRGEFFWGTVVITAFVFSDLVDGTMARMTERSSRWGAFLDSTLDRLGDAAIFGGLALEPSQRSLDALLTQPAVLSVPLAFATMALVSLAGPQPRRAPNAELLALHAPEGLGLGLEDEDVDAVRA
jgi:phosphatidylglycerophosphate synthase